MHVITIDGISQNPEKAKLISEMAESRNLKQLVSFLATICEKVGPCTYRVTQLDGVVAPGSHHTSALEEAPTQEDSSKRTTTNFW